MSWTRFPGAQVRTTECFYGLITRKGDASQACGLVGGIFHEVGQAPEPGGLCRPCHSSSDCEDGNPCTLDGCGADGICTHEPLSGMRCETKSVQCQEGNCSEGACIYAPTEGPCDDGNPCTRDDKCSDGRCVGVPLDKESVTGCEPIDAQCPAGCKGGKCTYLAGTCNDANACTVNDRCESGTCSGAPLDGKVAGCTTTLPCRTATCVQGGCEVDSEPLPDGSACDADHDLCTKGTCAAGTCEEPAIECPKSEDPCLVNECDPESGECALFSAPAGTPCEAFPNGCSSDDACDGSGQCKVGRLDHEKCRLKGLADGDDVQCLKYTCLDGYICVAERAPLNGTGCDDGIGCTSYDTCRSGECVGKPDDLACETNMGDRCSSCIAKTRGELSGTGGCGYRGDGKCCATLANQEGECLGPGNCVATSGCVP